MRTRARILVVVLVMTAALMAAVAPVGARSVSAPTNVTLTATVTFGGGWCCGTFSDFEGEAVIPSIGSVAFTGHWLRGCMLPFPPFPTPCFQRLDIDFVARNGDVLALRGNNEWSSPVEPAPTDFTWSTDQALSTGRFSGFAGSGTYVFQREGASATIVITGLRRNASASTSTWATEDDARTLFASLDVPVKKPA